jgi:hypothetical protein
MGNKSLPIVDSTSIGKWVTRLVQTKFRFPATSSATGVMDTLLVCSTFQPNISVDLSSAAGNYAELGFQTNINQYYAVNNTLQINKCSAHSVPRPCPCSLFCITR